MRDAAAAIRIDRDDTDVAPLLPNHSVFIGGECMQPIRSCGDIKCPRTLALSGEGRLGCSADRILHIEKSDTGVAHTHNQSLRPP